MQASHAFAKVANNLLAHAARNDFAQGRVGLVGSRRSSWIGLTGRRIVGDGGCSGRVGSATPDPRVRVCGGGIEGVPRGPRRVGGGIGRAAAGTTCQEAAGGGIQAIVMMKYGTDSATKAANGRSSAGGWVFVDLGFDVGFDWNAVKTAKRGEKIVSSELENKSGAGK